MSEWMITPKSQEPKAKSQKPKAKSQKPKAKSQKPKAKSQKIMVMLVLKLLVFIDRLESSEKES
ncbi:Uncharacterised protein [Serratia marcescens]|nr:Uncharacterised protein [Serratia marcescens]